MNETYFLTHIFMYIYIYIYYVYIMYILCIYIYIQLYTWIIQHELRKGAGSRRSRRARRKSPRRPATRCGSHSAATSDGATSRSPPCPRRRSAEDGRTPASWYKRRTKDGLAKASTKTMDHMDPKWSKKTGKKEAQKNKSLHFTKHFFHTEQNVYYLRHPACVRLDWQMFFVPGPPMDVENSMQPLRVSVTLHAWLSANLCVHRWIQTQQLGSSVVQGEIHRPTSKMCTTCICSMWIGRSYYFPLEFCSNSHSLRL